MNVKVSAQNSLILTSGDMMYGVAKLSKLLSARDSFILSLSPFLFPVQSACVRVGAEWA